MREVFAHTPKVVNTEEGTGPVTIVLGDEVSGVPVDHASAPEAFSGLPGLLYQVIYSPISKRSITPTVSIPLSATSAPPTWNGKAAYPVHFFEGRSSVYVIISELPTTRA
jgi:hypothetical protein